MPYRVLDQHFSKRMLPLAVAAGLVVAIVPPISYAVVTWPQLHTQAVIYASQLAAGVQTAAEHQPYLWRYNTPKVLQATAGHRGQRDIGAVTVTDCAGSIIFSPGSLSLGTGRADGPTGRASVHVGQYVVAWVLVRLDQRAQARTLAGIAAAAATVGVLIGLLLFLYPTRVVRRQARELAVTVGRLEEAEARLTGVNTDLADKVRRAVREVRDLSGRVVSIQEDERRRIARDLHDGVGQAVTALQIELQLAGGDAAGARRHIVEAGRLAEEILTEIRSTVSALRPVQIGAGLEEAVRASVERFEVRTGVPSSFRAQGDAAAVPEETATCLLRILQEALTNVSRHAAAGEVGVILSKGGDAVVLEVTDDGKGFDPGGVSCGSGLVGIRERAAFVGGEAEISSGHGGGTRIRVTIPLEAGA